MVMLDRLLGGTGGTVDPSHELTDIEIALVRNVVRSLLGSMREAWLNIEEANRRSRNSPPAHTWCRWPRPRISS